MKLRSVKYAKNSISLDVIYDASNIFNNGEKSSFFFQKQVLTEKLNLECLCCGNSLTVSYMPNEKGYKTFYFKHKSGKENCELIDCENNSEKEELERIYYSPESEKHKFLKSYLKNVLEKNLEVKILSFDDKYVLDNFKKRKPDIMILYKGNKIVIEVQISILSLKYIDARTKFYKENGIYVLWVLESFEQKEFFIRNIKYINENQNLFKINEQSPNFLICKYKFPFIKDSLIIHEKTAEKSISLSQLQFDENYEIYYFPYIKTKLEKNNELVDLIALKHRRNANQLFKERTIKVNKILSELSDLRKKGKTIEDYKLYIRLIDSLDIDSVSILNRKIEEKNKNYLLSFFKNANNNSFGILEFLLTCRNLRYDINKTVDGKNLIEIFLTNSQINIFNKKRGLLYKIVDRGYHIDFKDREIIKQFFISNQYFEIKDYFLFKIYIDLNDKSLRDETIRYYSVIMAIRSIIEGKIVGFNYKTNAWIQLFNLIYDTRSDCFGFFVDIIKLENKLEFFTEMKNGYKLLEKINESKEVKFRNNDIFKKIFNDLFEHYFWER